MPGTTEMSCGSPASVSHSVTAPDLQGGGKIDEVAGDRQMVRIAFFDIVHQTCERSGKEVARPVPVPIDETGDALGGEFAKRQVGQRAEMDVRNMRKFEHRFGLEPFLVKLNHSVGSSGAECLLGWRAS
ncbi:hypothetical protein ABIE77_005042 [Sinorhizobium fredii]